MNITIAKKTIPVSSKHQITIPQKFLKALEIESEVECILTGEEIIIRPKKNDSGYFAQQILNDLIDKGFSGEDLKKEFAKISKQVQPAIANMLQDVGEYAEKFVKSGYVDETKDIFGSEEK